MAVTPEDISVLRVTPMQVLPDITPTLRRYEALGFERIDTGDAGCVGMLAGQTSVILSSLAFMNGDFEAAHTARLSGQTIQYIHVSSVDRTRGRLSPAAVVLQDVVTRGGTRELLVEDDGELFILAEKVA
jgi:ethanolamine utilization microcompartment shell protein EutS